MINKSVLVGRLTKELELKYTTNGIANVRFTLAVNRAFSNQNGEKEADFIQCIAWKVTAENMVKYLEKGSLIGVVGRIQTSNFEGQDGKRVYLTQVVADDVQFIESKKDPQSQQDSGQGQYQQSSQQTQQSHYQQQQQQPNQHQQQYAGVGGGQQQGHYSPHNEVHDDDLPF